MKNFNYNPPILDYKIKKILLEKIKSRVNFVLSKMAIERLDPQARILDPVIEKVLIQLENEVWAEKLQENFVVYSEYITWWDYFKDRHMPKWFVKKYPVKKDWTRHVFKRWAKFPDFKFDSQGNKQEFVIYEEMERIDEF